MAKKATAAEFLEQVKNMADSFQWDKPEQKDEYINEHMKRAGYKPLLSWGDAENDGDKEGKSGGGWFPS